MATVSRYQLWLVAQHLAEKIEAMNSVAQPGSLVLVSSERYALRGYVTVSVRWPYQTTDDAKRAWAQRFAGRHGGTVTEEKPSYSSFYDLEIKGTAAHGIPYTLHVATLEPPAKSEQDGDEAEALNT